ncbi:MAG: response regulator, partial [Tannerellaceae bacterium]|nr:response regulator [Tannerellaceae bacterium]
MKLSCVIIDDEPLAVSLLESYVLKTPFLVLKGTYNSAVEALSQLSIYPVDVLFLDIQMPDLTGLEFSHMLGDNCRIIFTTAFEQYALDSYKVHALDYLLKPIAYSDFLQASTKALQWYELVKNQNRKLNPENQKPIPDTIFIKTEYKLIQVELRKILYIEGLKD